MVEIKTFGLLNLAQYMLFKEYRDKRYIIISIKEAPYEDYGISFTTQGGNCLGVLEMHFSDIDLSWDYSKYIERGELVLYSEEMAKEIVDFINEHIEKVDEILIHCHAGASRSVAVARAIEDYYGLKEFRGSKGLTNKYVYELTYKALKRE